MAVANSLSDISSKNRSNDFVGRKVLGTGAYSIVYDDEKGRAIKRSLDHKYNLYSMHSVKEAIVLSYLDHLNIISIESVKFGQHIELQMTKCFKVTKNISHVNYIKTVANVLDYLHSSDITHRDLKPENIMVDSNGDIKIIDWGLVGTRTAMSKYNSYFTYWYRPPEMLYGKSGNSKKGDVWSLAMTMMRWGYDLNINVHRESKMLEYIFDTFGLISPSPEKIQSLFPTMDLKMATCISGMMNYDYKHRWTAKDILKHFSNEKKKEIHVQKCIKFSQWDNSTEDIYSSNPSFMLMCDIQIRLAFQMNANKRALISAILISKKYMSIEKLALASEKDEIILTGVASLFIAMNLHKSKVSDLNEFYDIFEDCMPDVHNDKYRENMTERVIDIIEKLKKKVLFDIVFELSKDQLITLCPDVGFYYLQLMIITENKYDIDDLRGRMIQVWYAFNAKKSFLKGKLLETYQQLPNFRKIFGRFVHPFLCSRSFEKRSKTRRSF